MSSPTNNSISNSNVDVDVDVDMRVTKRNGELEDMAFDKILNRIKKLGKEANIQLNYTALAMKVIDQLYDKIETTKIDELTAEQCASLSSQHPDYGVLAGRVIISNHQKNLDLNFYTAMKKLYNNADVHGVHSPLISRQAWEHIEHHKDYLESVIDYSRDYLIDYFGFKTLERAYLMKVQGTIVENIQHMWMRVSVGIHGDDILAVKETYDLMSQKYFTHATPTLFNAGTNHPQLSSCFLQAMEDDSLEGIFNTLKDCAHISKWAGGVGLHIHNVRMNHSVIRSTNGKSNGIVPMLKVFNDTARFINQGGKRNGSFAIYLEPWHGDVEDFLDMKKNHGDEEQRARDLFYALWIPDLFMERIKENKEWSLFCPDECRGLSDVYGDEFKQLYEDYESRGLAKKTISARSLWFKVLDAQMETGTPYLCYKDACNQKSNQKNLGTIKSSNLCSEIIEYSDETETAVCNLASIALPSFVDTVNKEFDYNKLHEVTKTVTTNLNKVIDINFYPTPKTKKSNLLNRPIGIGVQGLADVFILMDLPFHSEEARVINRQIFETIYHASVERSNEIAIGRQQNVKYIRDEFATYGIDFRHNATSYSNLPLDAYVKDVDNKAIHTILMQNKNLKLMVDSVNPVVGELKHLTNDDYLGSYSTFEGSPASQGLLQFDLWTNTTANTNTNKKVTNERYDWDRLKDMVKTYGMRNSLLVALMPTASTSQILGFNECFEPLTSNIYTRRTLAGEFIVANKYLMRELIDLGIWNEQIKNNIVANRGSIQQLTMVPEHIRNKYKIVWEIPMKHLIDMSAERGVFVCQSQSLNLWMEDPNYNMLTSMHFYGWKQGLKTGIYYLRRKGKHQAQQFTIEPEKKTDNGENTNTIIDAETGGDGGCEMCSS